MEKYLRASKKQLAFISSLLTQLGEYDDTAVIKYSMDKANKRINSLSRKLEKRRRIDNQTKLL